MKMLLKVLKEVAKSIQIMVTSIAAGAVAAVAYLVMNGFKCLTDNITAKITIDTAQLNLTAIFNEYENKEPITLPIGVQLQDNNITQCATPLAIGAGIGFGVSLLNLTFNYARLCSKRNKEKEKEPRVINEESALLPQQRRACC
jgi:phage tail tape-measure protein